MKKTPLMKLIAEIDSNISQYRKSALLENDIRQVVIGALNVIKAKATELLAEEREEFEAMHMMGQSEWYPKADESAAVLCFTQTYGGGDE